MLQPDQEVQQAVRSFVPPSGYAAFPMPTKNNAQRSLIYVYGRRVQSTTDTRKSKWFCLASPQCRANGTTISTSANISGCMRHLHVFHDLVSPKTVQMNRKSEGGKLPDGQLEPALQDQNQQPTRSEYAATRERTLEWTICFAVRQLLPIAPLVQDQRLEKLLNLPAGFNEQRVHHHIVEIYATTLGTMKQMIQSELSKAQTPLLHLSFGPAFANEGDHAPTQSLQVIALSASFVSSEFELKRIVLGVTQIGSQDSSTKDIETALVSWALRVLRTFGILLNKHIRSCTVHSSLVQHNPMVKTALEGSMGPACHFSCVDQCLQALNGACTTYQSGCMKHLVVSLGEFARVVGHSELGIIRFQHLKSSLELVALGSKRSQQLYQRTEPEHTDDVSKMDGTNSFWGCSQYWSAVESILAMAVEVWTDLEMFFFSDRNQQASVAPDLLRAFNKNDLVQVLSMLQPIIQFIGDMEQAEYPAAPEALVRMIAIKRSTLNVDQPLQLIPGLMSSENDTELESVILSTDMTVFGRSSRQELASRWNQLVMEMLAPSMSEFAMCAFFHPCFRQLGHLEQSDGRKPTSQEGDSGDGQLDKSQLMSEIKRSARTIFQSKSTPLSSRTSESEEENASADPIPTLSAKKRRKTQLSRQAQELRRLGFLEETTTNPNGLQEHTSPLSEWVLTQEFDRYAKHESVAFGDIPFDRILSYWHQKTLEYPTIALVAQTALGHPVSANGHRVGLDKSSSQVAGHGRFFSELHCSDALTAEEMTLFLHFNQAYILPAIATLTDEQVAHFMASHVKDQP